MKHLLNYFGLYLSAGGRLTYAVYDERARPDFCCILIAGVFLKPFVILLRYELLCCRL